MNVKVIMCVYVCLRTCVCPCEGNSQKAVVVEPMLVEQCVHVCVSGIIWEMCASVCDCLPFCVNVCVLPKVLEITVLRSCGVWIDLCV